MPYAGQALASQTRYYWQVRVRDNDGRLSSWSQPAWFETAFLDPSQFQGSWITSPTPAGGSELLLRKDFTLASQGRGSQAITKARLYVAGLSYPYLYVNGHSVTSSVLNTDFTMFDKTVDYSTYDVTKLVRAGSDSLAVSLGNGFYAGGADDYPASGESWQSARAHAEARAPGVVRRRHLDAGAERRFLEGHHRSHDRQLAGRRDIRRAAGEAGVEPARL